MAKINIGNLALSKAYLGDQEIDKIYLGDTLLYSSMPQLATPTISLSGDTLSIEEVENAEYYDIYVDGVLKESLPAVEPPTFNNIHITLSGNSGNVGYKVNNGSWNETLGTYTENNVSKLEIYCFGDDDHWISIGTTLGGGDIYDEIIYAEKASPLDITQYLQDGCYVHILGDD